MLHILLLILKIIGIVILCILGALILGIVCVLFVPVRYRVEAVRKEGAGEPPVVLRVKVTWLLHFVNLVLRFDGSLFARARIMVITLFRLPKKEKRAKERRRRAKNGHESEEAVRSEALQEETAGSEALQEETAKDEAPPEETAGSETSLEETRRKSAEECAVKGQEEKEKFWDKLRAIPEILRGIFLKIKGFFENIQYTIRKFCDKIKSVSDTIEYYRGVIEGEAFQHSYALCKKELLRIARVLKPQKFQAKLIVGMEDPAVTGQILAYCGMLYPLIGGHVDVAGDFEMKRLEGHVLVKGKIRFFTFLRVAVKVYFNKDIKKLYRLLKKEAV